MFLFCGHRLWAWSTCARFAGLRWNGKYRKRKSITRRTIDVRREAIYRSTLAAGRTGTMAPIRQAGNTNGNSKKRPNVNGNQQKLANKKKMGKVSKNMAQRNGNVQKKKPIIKQKGAKDSLVQGLKEVPSKKKVMKALSSHKMKGSGPGSMPAAEKFSVVSGRPFNEVKDDEAEESNSIKDGRNAFSWLIAPVTPETFLKSCWERTPLHVKRSDFPDYYKDVLTTVKINKILQNNFVLFSKNVDVTSYRNGKRQTHNPAGRATPALVWDFYQKGCSVRMLNPQTFCPELLKLNSTLQDFFGCFVGANSYLTPANSQGFAPHYDDIEAFILQIEGKKHWRIYNPRKDTEYLPRFSSENFSQDEIGEPALEVTLNPGDLLYFPKGFIHQAKTLPNQHSLHITISCYQKNTWADFLEKLLPAALSQAVEEDVSLRRGLPVGYLSHVGVSHSDSKSEQREQFFSYLEKLMSQVMRNAPVDATADQMGKQFMHDALPPVLTSDEERCTIFSPENMQVRVDGVVRGSISLTAKTHVKLLRAHILRLVKEDADSDNVHVYHSVDNSLEYHGEEPQSFEVSADFALAVEHLVNSYPKFVVISDLPLDTQTEKLELANILWKKGLLMTNKPLHEKKSVKH